MASTPEFEPGPDWCEASAKFSTEQVCELKFFYVRTTFCKYHGHVRKMENFKSNQINFKDIFLSLVPNDIYHIICAIVLHVFLKNSV